MTLRDWVQNGWLAEQQTTPDEISNLLRIAQRDLSDSQTPGLSADWRLNIAYNAALQAATAALAAQGYRAGREAHHLRVIHSLEHTIGASGSLITRLDYFRKKRNASGYELSGATSDQEAKEMLALARKLRDEVRTWLIAKHPELCGGDLA